MRVVQRRRPIDPDLDRLRARILATEAPLWGARVRQRRTDLGLTQGQLADLVGVPFQTISKVENGGIVCRDYLKAALALRLAVEVDDLFPWPTRSALEAAA